MLLLIVYIGVRRIYTKIIIAESVSCKFLRYVSVIDNYLHFLQFHFHRSLIANKATFVKVIYIFILSYSKKFSPQLIVLPWGLSSKISEKNPSLKH